VGYILYKRCYYGKAKINKSLKDTETKKEPSLGTGKYTGMATVQVSTQCGEATGLSISVAQNYLERERRDSNPRSPA